MAPQRMLRSTKKSLQDIAIQNPDKDGTGTKISAKKKSSSASATGKKGRNSKVEKENVDVHESTLSKEKTNTKSKRNGTRTKTPAKKQTEAVKQQTEVETEVSPTKKRTQSKTSTKKTPARKKHKTSSTTTETDSPTDADYSQNYLPRTIEIAKKAKSKHVQFIIGIDEAGRGPLAGPVVAAAVVCPTNLDGVVDSKKISNEEDRERLYEELVNMKDISWAVCVVDAPRIDEINILQATLEGMKNAATALVNPKLLSIPILPEATIDHNGCFVVVSKTMAPGVKEVAESATEPFYALIDGNKIPKEMPCEAESVVKGDGKEFSIAAASILAKVTRDRLMHKYHLLYPDYNLQQHKGYPTAAHMQIVREKGATPIHRRSFAPLKFMLLDSATDSSS